MNHTEHVLFRRDRWLGGLWGLLIGSAFGEVRAAWLKHPPSKGSIRDRLAGASWAPEGAQVLCLLMALQANEVPLQALAGHAVLCARLGICFPDSEFRFAEPEGPLSSPALWGENYAALKRYQHYAIEQSALLFSLALLGSDHTDPAAVVHRGLILGRDACRDPVDKAALAMGVLWARAFVEDRADAWADGAEDLRRSAPDIGVASTDIQTVIDIPPGDIAHSHTHRMLYLLAHARQALEIAPTFEGAVDFAMAPRPDLRIPMAFVGMMAGLRHGQSGIPLKYLTQLRGREMAKQWVSTCVALDR